MKTQIDLYKGIGGYGTLGMEIVLSFLIGVFGGKWLDERYGTTPWLFLGGVALGAVLSIKAIARAMKLMRQVAEREEREQGNPRPLYESSSEREARAKRDGGFEGDPVIKAPFDGDEPVEESDPEAKPQEGEETR